MSTYFEHIQELQVAQQSKVENSRKRESKMTSKSKSTSKSTSTSKSKKNEDPKNTPKSTFLSMFNPPLAFAVEQTTSQPVQQAGHTSPPPLLPIGGAGWLDEAEVARFNGGGGSAGGASKGGKPGRNSKKRLLTGSLQPGQQQLSAFFTPNPKRK